MRISDWSSDVCSSDLHRDGGGNHVGQDGRAQAAANDEKAQYAVLGQRRIAVVADRDHLFAHRIAGQMALHRELLGEAMNVAIGDRDADRKSTRLNSSHSCASRMPSYA